MHLAVNSFALIEQMARIGNPNSVSDAGVGALCARAAVRGAFLNVQINTAGFADTDYNSAILAQANDLLHRAAVAEKSILDVVNLRIANA